MFAGIISFRYIICTNVEYATRIMFDMHFAYGMLNSFYRFRHGVLSEVVRLCRGVIIYSIGKKRRYAGTIPKGLSPFYFVRSWKSWMAEWSDEAEDILSRRERHGSLHTG